MPEELKQDYVDEQTGDAPLKRSVPTEESGSGVGNSSEWWGHNRVQSLTVGAKDRADGWSDPPYMRKKKNHRIIIESMPFENMSIKNEPKKSFNNFN